MAEQPAAEPPVMAEPLVNPVEPPVMSEQLVNPVEPPVMSEQLAGLIHCIHCT